MRAVAENSITRVLKYVQNISLQFKNLSNKDNYWDILIRFFFTYSVVLKILIKSTVYFRYPVDESGTVKNGYTSRKGTMSVMVYWTRSDKNFNQIEFVYSRYPLDERSTLKWTHKKATPQEKARCVSWVSETKSDTKIQINNRVKYGSDLPSRPSIHA